MIIFLLGYILAMVMGVALGLLGGGGSILTVPLLVYFFGLDGVSAITSSLCIVGITALVGALLSAKNKNIDLKVAVMFSLPSLISIYFVRQIVLPLIPYSLMFYQIKITKPFLLLVAFSGVMLLASLAMIRSGKKSNSTHNSEVMPSYAFITLRGFGVGTVTGFVGAGGGFLIIPALVLFLRLPMQKAVGTSLFIIAINSLFGFWMSPEPQQLSNPMLIVIIGAALVGLLIGARFAQKIDEARSKQLFGYFVLIVGTFLLFDQLLKMFVLA